MTNTRRIIFIILTIIWMVVIFAFSAKDADESGRTSSIVGLTIGKLVIVEFDQLPVEEQLAFAEKVDYPIRKTAHALEYMVLGLFITGSIYSSRLSRIVVFLISWALTTLYAASDEFHQLFVPGRSGEIRDVCIDSVGAIAGVLIGILILSRLSARKVKK